MEMENKMSETKSFTEMGIRCKGDFQRLLNVLQELTRLCDEPEDWTPGYNPNSGYAYVYSEDYGFSIGQAFNKVKIIYSDFESGEEHIWDASEFHSFGAIQNRINQLETENAEEDAENETE